MGNGSDKKEPRKNVELISDKKFLKFFDIQYDEGRHYYAATRRDLGGTFAVLSEKEGKFSIPDAVTVVFVIKDTFGNSYLYMNYEYRYAAGRFLLSPPAGLIDENEKSYAESSIKDIISNNANEEELFEAYGRIVFEIYKNTSVRELKEETGYDAKDAQFTVLSNLVFSSPGMSDESNAFIKCVLTVDDIERCGDASPDGSELFRGRELISKEQARKLINDGRDKFGNFYSIYTYCALKEFLSD